MNELTHVDKGGAAHMVDVSAKDATEREAVAEATVAISEAAFAAISNKAVPKGDVFAAARIAGIMAAKKTAELIPLCHPLALTGASVELELLSEQCAVRVRANVKTSGPTGVEMEALTAVSVAALTLYDMIKAIDKTAAIENIHLVSKSGGKSGSFLPPAKAEQPQRPRNEGSRARQRPSVLSEVAAPVPPRQSGSQRDALRTFMQSRRLRASVWANDAGVASSQLYAFLTGRLRSLPADVIEKLARAARVRPEDMFR
jgi:cyclic pyranopterin monophosphate synthase